MATKIEKIRNIAISNNRIENLYLGENKIIKGYLGNILIYGDIETTETFKGFYPKVKLNIINYTKQNFWILPDVYSVTINAFLVHSLPGDITMPNISYSGEMCTKTTSQQRDSMIISQKNQMRRYENYEFDSLEDDILVGIVIDNITLETSTQDTYSSSWKSIKLELQADGTTFNGGSEFITLDTLSFSGGMYNKTVNYIGNSNGYFICAKMNQVTQTTSNPINFNLLISHSDY